MAVLRNLTMSPLHKRRQRRGRLGLPGEAGLEGSEPSDALGPDDKKDGDLDTDELLKGEGQVGESQCQSNGSMPVEGMLDEAALPLPVTLKPQLVFLNGSVAKRAVPEWWHDGVKRACVSDAPPSHPCPQAVWSTWNVRSSWRAPLALMWSLAKRRRRKAKSANANPIGLVRPWGGAVW